MEQNDTFSKELFAAIEEKSHWFDTTLLPDTLSLYRNFHANVKNIIETCVAKGILHEDPYKKDFKISDVELPDESRFAENERVQIMSIRLSQYESTIDFICNYLKFSVSNLTIERIKKLVAINNYIQWEKFSNQGAKQITATLFELLISIRQGSDTFSISLLNNIISSNAKIISQINAKLKQLTDFEKEYYKAEIRKGIFEHPSFSYEKAKESENAALTQIRKLFPAVLGQTPFYTELVLEIIQEEFSPQKEQLRKKLLEKLKVDKVFNVQKKTKTIDTKEILMDAIRSLASVVPQIEQIILKIEENKDFLINEKNSFWDKFVKLLKKAFNVKESPITYRLVVNDSLTQTKRNETIIIQDFIAELIKRNRYYSNFAIKKTPGYMKIYEQTEPQILEFLKEQLNECNTTLTLLNALDDFFKAAPQPEHRSQIKGLKMEITAVKNTLVKTNQRRAEYVALIEEQEQMKKLGITDE